MADHDHAAGAGRRLTAEEEERGAEMFAAGAATRAVAAELGCGAGTASRLRQRLEARGTLAPGAAASDLEEASGPDQPEPYEAELAGLRAEAGELAETVRKHEERAAISRAAVEQLEAERIEALAAGRDALPLRQRRRDAEDDARDSADAAALVRQRLDGVAAQIAAIGQRRAFADMRAGLAEAVAECDAVCAGTGDRQRAAVRAVRDAALEFTAAVADEQASVARVQDLAAAVTAMALQLGEQPPAVSVAASSALWVAPDIAIVGGPLALSQADHEARRGNAPAVARLLGECYGWLPSSPAERAAEEAEYRKRAEAMAAAQPKAEAPKPWPNASPDSVGLDAQGRPLPWRPAPHPMDFYNAPANWGGGG